MTNSLVFFYPPKSLMYIYFRRIFLLDVKFRVERFLLLLFKYSKDVAMLSSDLGSMQAFKLLISTAQAQQRSKMAAPVDLELKKAFTELQAKVIDTQQKVKLADV